MEIYHDLIKNATRFKRVTGMTIEEFDSLYTEVAKKHPKMEEKRLDRPDRKRAIGAGRRHVLNLKDRLVLCLFYIKTYATQEVVGMFFKLSQGTVSNTVSNMSLVIKDSLPTPKKIYAKVGRIKTIGELEKMFRGLTCLTDASEQPIQKPKRRDMEKSHYSGKAHTHTAKVQYTMNCDGLIVHKTAHSPGSVNDITIFKKKHPSFPEICSPDGDNSVAVRLRNLMDKGYMGAQKIENGTRVILPIRKRPGKKLSEEEKSYNNCHSSIRIYVENGIRRIKVFRIMGDKYRNPLKKYDMINSIVCGLVNLRILAKMAASA